MIKLPVLCVAALFGVAISAGAATGKGDAAKGKALFEEKCAGCHGKDGKAETDLGKKLKPHPANLSDTKAMAEKTQAEIVKIITDGGKASGRSPLMAAWGTKLGEDGVRDVVEHMKQICKCAFK